MRKAMSVIGLLLLAAISYPSAEKRPVVQTYGETKFTDNYQWLENASDADVKAWVAAENQLTRSVLDAVPARQQIAHKLTQLLTAPRVGYYDVEQRGGKVFALKNAPPKQQPLLVAFDLADPKPAEKVVYDPNAADASGSTEIDFYVPSLDAKLVAISLSRNGSEDGSVHVFDVASGKEQGDVIPRVNFGTAGGSVAWNSTATGFWYTRYPQGNERPTADINFYQQIWYHKLGDPLSSDKYILGKDFPRIAEIGLETSVNGRNVLATVRNGDGGQAAHYVAQPGGKWVQITQFSDGILHANFGEDGQIYLLSHNGAPNGKLLRVSPDDPVLAKAKVIVPESQTSIDAFAGGHNSVYVAMMAGGPSQLVRFSSDGKSQTVVPTPDVSSTGNLVVVDNDDDLLFRNATYTKVPQWLRYDTKSKSVSPAPLRNVSAGDLGDAQVVREMATSKDGTKIPINVIYSKGTQLDGTSPLLLVGYGGYAISERPSMSLANKVWLEAGGIIARPNLRGGTEYGEAWHQAGRMLKKQNVFDDFAAVAQYLVARKYTSPNKLAIEGGSNGGLLMGVEMTQHPEMFKAVVSHAGIYDVPRWLRTPNGVFNVEELGSPDNAEQLANMLAYSPYHHVVDGTKYPAALFLTGDNDFRVDPMNSRKFVARLQAANASENPILLRTTSSAGHGIGTALNEGVASQTDVFAFLWMELEMHPLQAGGAGQH